MLSPWWRLAVTKTKPTQWNKAELRATNRLNSEWFSSEFGLPPWRRFGATANEAEFPTHKYRVNWSVNPSVRADFSVPIFPAWASVLNWCGVLLPDIVRFHWEFVSLRLSPFIQASSRLNYGEVNSHADEYLNQFSKYETLPSFHLDSTIENHQRIHSKRQFGRLQTNKITRSSFFNVPKPQKSWIIVNY